MPSLIPQADISGFTGALADHFDTFKREIVVYKEPQRVVNSGPFDSVLAGYEDSSSTNISYVPVSGVYSGLIVYEDEQDTRYVNMLNSNVNKGVIKIKVEKNARDFIKNGKTERIEVDEKSFNTISNDKIQSYLGLNYYIFYLEATD
tara:strand:- start:1873 stop:2313 length:441 start_codon:yes stop_codon:yes gene_type:complete